MRFRRTTGELDRIQAAFAAPVFHTGEQLSVEFLTRPEIVERLLPPPLEPAEAPVVVASVGRWRSPVVGDYAGGSLYLAARHDGVDGGYPIVMYMDTEASVTFGREVFGEPKRLASSRLFHNGPRFHAHLERHGTRFLELQAELGGDEGPAETDRCAFNFRARPAADGCGLEDPVALTHTTFSAAVSAQRHGTGTVTLRSTPHEPVEEIEVVSVLRAFHQEHDIAARCAVVGAVPADAFLPYHYGRTDNWLAFAPEGR